jgi:hypothetical protein
MRTSFAAVALAVGAAITVAPGSAANADGYTSAAATGAKSQLKLTIAHGERARPALRTASLTCGPAGGSHPRARDACAALAAVGGDFGALHVDTGACTMQYDPVTVTATGLWRGKPVRYRHTFGNSCTLHLETGPVFAL